MSDCLLFFSTKKELKICLFIFLLVFNEFMTAVYNERTAVYVVDEVVYIEKYKPLMRWGK